ncbi:MAG: hypothetical protein GF308_17850 [Candidatus Heimdallarchaeota archaeon]|nr:hypothetical protein [Candidatus Heimdallarchaeota archaeon]
MSELAAEEKILDQLKEQFGDQIMDTEIPRKRRINVHVADPVQRDIIQFGKEKFNAWHIIAISGVDVQEHMEVVYAFDIQPPAEDKYAITLNIHVKTDRDTPNVKTITDMIPGSSFFEREAHDLLGINFDGHPNLDRLILPDDWPKGQYPLRKDFLLDIQKKEQAGKS